MTMIRRVNSLTVGVPIPLIDNTSSRLFDYFERASFSDWNYEDSDSERVIDHRVYVDGGPESYSANRVGVLSNVYF